MESIVQLRHMMAEQKFYEVQRLVEVQLSMQSDVRHELLLLYLETMQLQQKQVPLQFLIEIAEHESEKKNHDFVISLLENVQSPKHFGIIAKMQIKAAEDKGQMDVLYQRLSQFLIRQYEEQVPLIPDWASLLINKYFKTDFNLKLKQLALCLLIHDLAKAETYTKDLIIYCIEKPSPKGTGEKFRSIAEVLQAKQGKGVLEIYQNFCLISSGGIEEKSDYKRLVEMVIYFEDFKFQVLLLNLLVQLGLSEEASDFSQVVKRNKEYSFVYFDKYYRHLKHYFTKIKTDSAPREIHEESPDLTLNDSGFKYEAVSSSYENEPEEHDDQYLYLLKHQEYSADQLCDLAVSFLQSEMPKVALKASNMALSSSSDKKSYLKASYLRLTCLLMLKDFRAAVDTCFDAITQAETKDDILSFLYGQAEAYIRLNQIKEAKATLKRILSIDSDYRFAKERLEKL